MSVPYIVGGHNIQRGRRSFLLTPCWCVAYPLYLEPRHLTCVMCSHATQNAKLSGGGAVGDRSLDYLKLSNVLKPGVPLHSIFAGRWFGLW